MLGIAAKSSHSPVVRDDVEPVVHELRDRIVTGAATVVPFLLLAVAGWQAWGGALRASDLVIFAALYVATALGVTVGFHRLFTHRSFATTRPVRVILAVLGSAAVEGPVISWVADHRKHHAFSDHEGDPHSPHVGHGGGWRGTLRGLLHAHLGWLFMHDQRGRRSRYAPDLLADPAVRFVDRTFGVWVLAGLAAAVRARLPGRRVARGRAHGAAVGRRGAAARAAPRHVLDQLAVPLLRPAPLRDQRRVAQPGLARAAVDGGGVAQQPPRVPDVGRARACGRGRSTRPRS